MRDFILSQKMRCSTQRKTLWLLHSNTHLHTKEYLRDEILILFRALGMRRKAEQIPSRHNHFEHLKVQTVSVYCPCIPTSLRLLSCTLQVNLSLLCFIKIAIRTSHTDCLGAADVIFADFRTDGECHPWNRPSDSHDCPQLNASHVNNLDSFFFLILSL